MAKTLQSLSLFLIVFLFAVLVAVEDVHGELLLQQCLESSGRLVQMLGEEGWDSCALCEDFERCMNDCGNACAANYGSEGTTNGFCNVEMSGANLYDACFCCIH